MRQNPYVGIHQTPVAVMTDFYAGWLFPNYNDILYRVWGNIPYGRGDYFTNNVFDLLYPGYQVSSFYHDESGFATATPYGDNADALLSDAPAWLLQRYSLLIVTGELAGGQEIKDKLQAYINAGGHLIITATNLQKLPGGLSGITTNGESHRYNAGQILQLRDTVFEEDRDFELLSLQVPETTTTIASAGDQKAVVHLQTKQGAITVMASRLGIGTQPQRTGTIEQKEDTPLPNPYPLLYHVRRVLEQALEKQKLFDVGKDLSLITCRRNAGEYVLGIGNNSWDELPLNIISFVGKVKSIEELKIDQSEKRHPEYLPEKLIGKDIGKSTKLTIAGGDFRIFVVRVEEKDVIELPNEISRPRPFTKILPLRHINSLQEEVLARATFFQHFDGAIVDWKYLHQREESALQAESSWINLQKLQLWIDLSSGINLFPDLRLVNNVETDYSRSMETIKNVIHKAKILGAKSLILSLHTSIENNISPDQTWHEFKKNIKEICQLSAESGITVHLKNGEGNKMPHNLDELTRFVVDVNEPNLKVALNTAVLIHAGVKPSVLQKLDGKIGAWLISAPQQDLSNRLWNINSNIHSRNDLVLQLRDLVRVAPDASIIPDAILENKDDEYRESVAVDSLMREVPR